MNTEPMPITTAFRDKNLLGAGIKNFATFETWLVFLSALFGLGMSPQQLEVFTRHTKRRDIPRRPFKTAVCIAGRRSGKSFIAAVIAVWAATFRSYQQYLAPGEMASIKVIAVDRLQTRTIIRFIIGILQAPLLKQRVKKITATTIELRGSVVIEVQTADSKNGERIHMCCGDSRRMLFFCRRRWQ
jgi:hypothetical protein